jgi:hypothetical protein
MREDLDKALVEDFPLLYTERSWSMRETCMCWGFPGDGWEPLIRELSEKLEPLIEQFVKDNPDTKCSRCDCDKNEHTDDGCSVVHKVPYGGSRFYAYTKPELWKDLTVRYPGSKKFAVKKWGRNYRKMIKTKVRMRLNKYLLTPLFEKGILVKDLPCSCKGYFAIYPRAVQVKEKFGTLRFYMTYRTKEMRGLISEAYSKSEVTCEECGAPGKLRNRGWWKTRCDDCEKK